MKKRTIEEIHQLLKVKNMKLIEEYKGKVSLKHFVECLICQNKENKPLNYIFQSKFGCNICAQEERQKSRRGTDYLERMINKDENYKWLEEMPKNVSNTQKVKLKINHLDCGLTYKTSVTQFKKGLGRCPVCSKKNKIVKVINNPNYKEIINMRKKEREEKKKEIISDNRRISKVNRFLLEQTIKNRKDGKDYEWLEEYSFNNKEKHFIRHNICNYIYEVRPNDFQQGYSCPNCSRKSSKLEREILELISKKNYSFEIEKKIERFKFDIYIDELKLFIEIDGEQHFDLNSSWNKKTILKRII